MPSGDSLTSDPPFFVTCIGCPPPAGIFQIWFCPERFEAKYIHRPSFDQLGAVSSETSEVRRRGFLSSTLISNMSEFSSDQTLKAICVPSGDHARFLVAPSRLVNWRVFAPFSSQSHISNFPVRAEMNAMRFPSGEYCGSKSARVDEMRRLGGEIIFPCCEN